MTLSGSEVVCTVVIMMVQHVYIVGVVTLAALLAEAMLGHEDVTSVTGCLMQS